jgi:hypothetical protein
VTECVLLQSGVDRLQPELFTAAASDTTAFLLQIGDVEKTQDEEATEAKRPAPGKLPKGSRGSPVPSDDEQEAEQEEDCQVCFNPGFCICGLKFFIRYSTASDGDPNVKG